jgi:hypothetical protein
MKDNSEDPRSKRSKDEGESSQGKRQKSYAGDFSLDFTGSTSGNKGRSHTESLTVGHLIPIIEEEETVTEVKKE